MAWTIPFSLSNSLRLLTRKRIKEQRGFREIWFPGSRDPERPRPAKRKYNSCDTFTWSIKSRRNRPIDVFLGLPCPIDSSWSSSRIRGLPQGLRAPGRTATRRTPRLERQNRKAHYFNASGSPFSSPLISTSGPTRAMPLADRSCLFSSPVPSRRFVGAFLCGGWFVGEQTEEKGDAHQAKAEGKTPQPWRIVRAMFKRSAQLLQSDRSRFCTFWSVSGKLPRITIASGACVETYILINVRIYRDAEMRGNSEGK